MTGEDWLEAGAHLQTGVGFGEGSEELGDALPVAPQHAVLDVLQREDLSTNQVAHVVEELKNKTTESLLVMGTTLKTSLI